MPLIELRNIHKQYYRGDTVVPVLSGIELTIQEGEFVALGGPSGSGKSTLCNLIGLIDSPDRGEILFEGRNVARLSDEEGSSLRNRSIGFVFQNFNLIAVLTARENAMVPLEIMGIPHDQARDKAMRQLKAVALVGYENSRPQQLSGGEQQRVALARALVTSPALVIADEPTANLDSVATIQIIDLMRDLNEQTGTTFLFASHDEHLLERVQRRLQLQDGAIVSDSALLMKRVC
jgi:putative ABC transport system ATP-binding protein